MARTSKCPLCGKALKAGVAAHHCPHGRWCRYRCGADGLPSDWKTPECEACRVGEQASNVVDLATRRRESE